MYSVIDQPIVTVRVHDSEKDVGLRELITHAHEYDGLAGNTIEQYAVLRFVSAFVMDMLAMKTAKDRKYVLDQKKFDADTFDKYVKECNKDHFMFDLFDSERPFFQSTYSIKEIKKIHVKPASVLDLYEIYGNASTFRSPKGGVLGHIVERDTVFSIPKAFRAMCARQCFCAYSLEGPCGINKLPVYIFAIGENLFETIMFHTLSEEETLPRKYGLGLVPWKGRRDMNKNDKVLGASVIEALTWTPRRIQLIPSSDGVIRNVRLGKGAFLEKGVEYYDLHAVYVKKKNGEIVPLCADSSKDSWNTIVSVMSDSGEDIYIIPDAIKKLVPLLAGSDAKVVSLRACGLDKDPRNYKFFGSVSVDINMPESILGDHDCSVILRKDMKLVTDCNNALFFGIKMCVDEPAVYDMVKSGKKPVFKKKVFSMAENCSRFLSLKTMNIIQDLSFSRISDEMDVDEYTDEVCDAVKEAVKESISYLYDLCGNSSSELLHAAHASKWINNRVNSFIKERKGIDNGNDEVGPEQTEEA
jgi:hypothetical protein